MYAKEVIMIKFIYKVITTLKVINYPILNILTIFIKAYRCINKFFKFKNLKIQKNRKYIESDLHSES